MKNVFFRMALSQASRLLGKPARIVQLVARLLYRLSHVDKKELTLSAFQERFQVLARLLSAYTRGQYRAVPIKTIASVVAAVIYFLNPVDLIPDALLGLGLTDDIVVLSWVYQNAKAEIHLFLQWEKALAVSVS
jgi:uncharacterized membrane protein YkvA (DUF1232 family)